MSPPVYVITWGFTFAPLAEGEVSTWAMNPILGTFPYAGWLRGKIGGHRGHHISVLVDAGVLQAEIFQFLDKEVQQVELLLCARIVLRVILGLSVDLGITDKPVQR